jgi:hypothetical protein
MLRQRCHPMVCAAFWTASLIAATPPVDMGASRSALEFEPNRGQTSAEGVYLARSSSGTLLLTRSGVRLADGSGFDFVGGDPDAAWDTGELSGNITSYYIGRDSRNHLENIPHYRRLTRRQVYPGIDLVWYARQGKLEYDLIVAPHADPSRLLLRFTKTGRLTVTSDGALEWKTDATSMLLRRPVLSQTLAEGSRSIVGGWRALGRNRAALFVASYDRESPLLIDPVLEFSTYWGGSGEDTVVAADSSGIVVGNTTSLDFPRASPGGSRGRHIYATVPLSTGARQTLIFGGSGEDYVTSASISPNFGRGQAPSSPILIGGYTTSRDLPVGVPSSAWIPWQKHYAGGSTDGFVLLLTSSYGRVGMPDGIQSFLTYVGTPGDDRVTGVYLGSFGGSSRTYLSAPIALCGSTNGRGLPRAFHETYATREPEAAGGLDIFVISGTAVTQSTPRNPPDGLSTPFPRYVGGSGDDVPYAIAPAPYFNPFDFSYYVAGATSSPDFPLGNGRTASPSGSSDAFLIAVGNTYAGVLFGGSGWERAFALAVARDEVLIAGATSSTDLVQLNPLQDRYGGGPSDAFLARFDLGLTRLTGSTWIGGSGEEAATALAVDAAGVAAVGGWTASADLPLKDPLQPRFGGGPTDGFLAQIDGDGALLQSTWFGGTGEDRITFVTSGPKVWFAGQTSSPDLPVQTADQKSLQGPANGFVARMNSQMITAPVSVVCPKDSRVNLLFLVDFASVTPTTPFTISSSDPDKVLVAREGPAQRTITSTLSGSTGFVADCLDDHGGADLTVSVPGFPARVIRVNCVPVYITVSAANRGPSQVPSLPSTTLKFGLSAGEPGKPLAVLSQFDRRPGAPPLRVEVSRSDPTVGSVLPDSCQSVSGGFLIENGCLLIFSPEKAGSTVLSFTAGSVPISPSSLTVNVIPYLTKPFPATLALPTGFQYRLFPSFPPQPKAVAIGLSSDDPTQVVISSDAARPGGSSLSYSPSGLGAFWVQVQGTNRAALRFSVTQQDDIVVPVTVTRPVALLRPPLPFVSPLMLGVGETIRITLVVGGESGASLEQLSTLSSNSLSGYTPNPGKSYRFAITSSNPLAVRMSASSADLFAPNSSLSFDISGLQEGETILSVQAPDGFASSLSEQQLRIVVLPRAGP